MLTLRRQNKEVKGIRSSFRAVMRWSMLVLVVVPLGSACSQEATPPAGKSSSTDPEPLPEVAEQALAFGGELAVVFAVDRDGKVKAYYNKNTRPVKGNNFPKKKTDLTSTTSVSIFQTLNPTTCWLDTLGNQECVSWPDP